MLEASEYPNLIKQGERVSTIAVPTVLVAFNWPANSNRYQRVARFVDYLFSRIDKLQAPGFDPKWKSINLGCDGPRPRPLPGGAGMAGSSGARKRRHRNEDRRDLPALSRSGRRAQSLSHKARAIRWRSFAPAR